MVKTLKKTKRKFPTPDALEFAKTLENPVVEVKKTPKRSKLSEEERHKKRQKIWSIEGPDGHVLGSADAASKLGVVGAKAMLTSVPLSTASVGRFFQVKKPAYDSPATKKPVKSRPKKTKKKTNRFGSKSTKAPKIPKPDAKKNGSR
eukprot:Blabericola_migrator_1__11716@NODE_708_length_6780_cov_78_864442_g513_i0_p5_GENE_NODE_708_length_6780_cov_78_864442_g513_i0NODE_708_length_6780_cov_78_864442_g513_i0_p5_ORF_typecomplete_len147_score37_40JHY/PF15261_6/0_14JHY/PF15261_6/2_4e02_NODE_708_length_6780_cov_78_864442_g513_i051855625